MSSCLPAIHEFPTDLFSNKERQHGAVLLHILGVSGPRSGLSVNAGQGKRVCRAWQSRSVSDITRSPHERPCGGTDPGLILPTKKQSLKDARRLAQCHTESSPGVKIRI